MKSDGEGRGSGGRLCPVLARGMGDRLVPALQGSRVFARVGGSAVPQRRGWGAGAAPRSWHGRAPFLLLPGSWKRGTWCFRSTFHFKMMLAEFNLMTAQRLPLPIRTSEFALFRLTSSQSDRYEAGK